jgi:hypothetical protein
VVRVAGRAGAAAAARCSRSYRAVEEVPIAITSAVRTTNPMRVTAGHSTISQSSVLDVAGGVRPRGTSSSERVCPPGRRLNRRRELFT